MFIHVTFWSFLSTYSILSFEKNVYQNLIFGMGSGETVEEKRGKEDMKSVMHLYAIRITTELHERITVFEEEKIQYRGGKLNTRKSP